MKTKKNKESKNRKAMRKKIISFWSPRKTKTDDLAGFTMLEVLIASAIMLVVIIGALALYSRSNQISVDQQQYAELQHDVRSAMFLMTRDVRMAGSGMPPAFFSYALEGFDNENQGTEVRPDRLKLLGNMDEPLNLRIYQYQGSSVVIHIADGSFEQYPYPEEFYEDKIVLILPNPASPCRQGEIRKIFNAEFEPNKINMPPGQAPGINPPRGLMANSPCQSNDFDGGLVMFANVKDYWLDTSGKATFEGKTLTPGVNGYVGEPGILYMTNNNVHFPLAQNIENLQFEYRGDFDDDGKLDNFSPWNNTWTDEQVTRIRQVRIIIVGRTPSRFVSVSGKVPANIHNYRRPTVSNSPGSNTDDYHRRFILETTVNIRNLNINIYNTGQR